MTTLSKFPFSVWERAHRKVQAELISAAPGVLRQQVSDSSTSHPTWSLEDLLVWEESSNPPLLQGSGSSHLVLVLGDPVVVGGGSGNLAPQTRSPYPASENFVLKALRALMVQD